MLPTAGIESSQRTSNLGGYIVFVFLEKNFNLPVVEVSDSWLPLYCNTNPKFPGGDGLINVLDVVSTVNIVLGQAEWVDSADYNSDGIINILDIVSIVNIIMNNI